MGETSEEMNKTIIFLHGFFASGSCVPATALKEAFEGKYNVLTPDLPLHPHDALTYVLKLCEVYDPVLLVGNSCGAFYAQMVSALWNVPALLSNPYFLMTDFLRERKGEHQYKSPRADGKQNFFIDEELIEEFDGLQSVQFNKHSKAKVWGIFGDNDPIAHFEPMFLEHYEVSYHFPGAHTPTAEEIKAYHVPLIEKMMKEKDPMEWKVLESEYLYKRPWLTARREHVKLPTGAEIQDFYVLEYPEFCNVIAITKDGKFLMERQYRHAQHLTGIEIPAGAVVAGELTKTSGCALH